MRWIAFLMVAVVTLAGVVACTALVSGHADEAVAAISAGTLPQGYRDWKLISVAHEEGNLNDIRAILGNDVAIGAYRKGGPPFPDGTIIARLAWKYVPSAQNNKVFGRSQSFVAGDPVNIQFMVKESTKYGTTSGWRFAQFDGGRPVNESTLKSCVACHHAADDFVFTHYAR